MRRKLLVLPVLLTGLVGLSPGQPPGFGGGDRGERRMQFGGPGGPDPDMIWGMVSKGQPTINLNDPANARTKDRMVRDGTPIPADGILTKDAFKANFQASMAKRVAGGAAPGGPPVQVQMGTPGVPPTGFGGDRGDRRGGGSDPSAMNDEQVRDWMRRSDADGDGRISAAESVNSSGGLRDGFTQYDINRDGFIDVAEYRGYATARFASRGQPQTPGMGMPLGAIPQFPPPMPGQPPVAPGQPGSDEPNRPEVLRYGKLPKGAPSWMLAPSTSNREGLDADRDGQIGLYEWRRASGKKTSEFVEKDLNGDGYLTYTEYKTWTEQVAERQKQEDPDAPPPAVITPGGPPAAGERNRGDRPDRSKDGKDDRKGRRNPFANGNKGG